MGLVAQQPITWFMFPTLIFSLFSTPKFFLQLFLGLSLMHCFAYADRTLRNMVNFGLEQPLCLTVVVSFIKSFSFCLLGEGGCWVDMWKHCLCEIESRIIWRKNFQVFLFLIGYPETQDCGLPAVQSLVSCLPNAVRSNMSMKLGERKNISTGKKLMIFSVVC